MAAPAKNGPLQVVDENFDPLKVLKESYDPDAFYCRSTDHRGHHDQTAIKMPQGQISAIWQIVNAYPEYKSVQDFIRDAIVHWMHKRNEDLQDPQVERRLRLDIATSQSAALLQEIADLKVAVETHRKVLEEAAASQDWMLLDLAISQIEAALDEMREPYRGQVVEDIARFKRILDQNRG